MPDKGDNHDSKFTTVTSVQGGERGRTRAGRHGVPCRPGADLSQVQRDPELWHSPPTCETYDSLGLGPTGQFQDFADSRDSTTPGFVSGRVALQQMLECTPGPFTIPNTLRHLRHGCG